jgi:amidase
MFGQNDAVNAVIDRALAAMKAQGAVLVDPVELKNVAKYGDVELELLLFELKAGWPGTCRSSRPARPCTRWPTSLLEQAARRARAGAVRPGPARARRSQARTGFEGIPRHRRDLPQVFARRRHRRAAGRAPAGRDRRPHGSPAWLTDIINGDHPGDSFSSPAAVAGYPHVTVPAGMVFGLPVGLSFVGAAYSEPTLIGLAYAFEQATQARRPPAFTKSVKMA